MRLFPAPNGSAGRQIKPAARGSRKPEICGHDRAVLTGDSLISMFAAVTLAYCRVEPQGIQRC